MMSFGAAKTVVGCVGCFIFPSFLFLAMYSIGSSLPPTI